MELSQEQITVLSTLADAVKGMGTDKKGAYAHQGTGFTLHGPGGIFSTFGLRISARPHLTLTSRAATSLLALANYALTPTPSSSTRSSRASGVAISWISNCWAVYWVVTRQRWVSSPLI